MKKNRLIALMALVVLFTTTLLSTAFAGEDYDPEEQAIIDRYSSKDLYLGSTGQAVRNVQNDLLNKYGFDPGIIDGSFGSNTRKAVYSFQSRAGLNVDGYVGMKTKGKLYYGYNY